MATSKGLADGYEESWVVGGIKNVFNDLGTWEIRPVVKFRKGPKNSDAKQLSDPQGIKWGKEGYTFD